jgi:hypothetical protein
MRRTVSILVLAGLLGISQARAEFLQIDLSIFGMD